MLRSLVMRQTRLPPVPMYTLELIVESGRAGAIIDGRRTCALQSPRLHIHHSTERFAHHLTCVHRCQHAPLGAHQSESNPTCAHVSGRAAFQDLVGRTDCQTMFPRGFLE